MKNPFQEFILFLVRTLIRVPWLSTWVAALLLSSAWTFSWLAVFFLSTWLLDLTTTTHDFVNIFFLSISAEAVLRWAENTNFIARLSKPYVPNALGDNSEFNFMKAGFLFFLGCSGMFLFNEYFEKAGFKDQPRIITGQQGKNGLEQLNNMLSDWWLVMDINHVTTALLVGTLFRAIIYKRSHERPRLGPIQGEA